MKALIVIFVCLLAILQFNHGRAARADSRIIWKGNWAHACDFRENNLKNIRLRGEDCGGACARTRGCTHFAWTKYNGGTCWMKRGKVTRANAFYTGDNSMVCGIP